MVASMSSRVVSPSLVLLRLGSYARQNRIHQALAEIGRIHKTVHILRTLDNEEYRRRMGRDLNKGEASHELSRFLCFGKEGALRGWEFGDQLHTFSCLSVLHNAVVTWNMVHIEPVVEQLRAEGQRCDDELLSLTTRCYGGISTRLAVTTPIWCECARMAVNWWNSRRKRQLQNALALNGGFRLDVVSTRLSKNSLRSGCCTIFWSFGKSHHRIQHIPFAVQSTWSKKAKRPFWSREDAKTLLDSIPKDSVSGLRDLALIAAMFYSFARVSAVLKLKVDDYYRNGARRRLRLHEKGGKEHDMPVHHLLEQILNQYIEAAGLQSGQPLFQSVNPAGMEVTGRALNRYNAWAAIRKRAKAAGFLTPVGCHTWRATGITIYLENDGRLEHAQQMAGHESPRTTKLYDRTKDEITLSEVERIRL